MNKVLIVRTDRVGDVLLTTPMGSALRQTWPRVRIHWLVRPYTAPLLQNNPDVDHIHFDREQSTAALAQELRAERFDAAIVALPRWRVACALFRAGIPRRIGPASKLYSVLFTERFWQHRSEGEKHEADFNLDLLASLGVSNERRSTRLILTDSERCTARQQLEGHRIGFRKPLVILHPGSGGSSARWPLAHFMKLGDRLQEGGCDVAVTGGPGEDYQAIMIDQMHRIPVFIPAGSVSLRELAAQFSCADLVVTNSTGPLHIAVAIDTPTVSVYSPLRTCHPDRWGPYPAWPERSGRHAVVVAPGSESSGAEMDKVSVDTVWALCEKQLREGRLIQPAAETFGAPS